MTPQCHHCRQTGWTQVAEATPTYVGIVSVCCSFGNPYAKQEAPVPSPVHMSCTRPLDEAAPEACEFPLDHEPDAAELELLRQEEEDHRHDIAVEASIERRDALKSFYIGSRDIEGGAP